MVTLPCTSVSLAGSRQRPKQNTERVLRGEYPLARSRLGSEEKPVDILLNLTHDGNPADRPPILTPRPARPCFLLLEDEEHLLTPEAR